MARALRAIGIVLFLVAGGFVIYGGTLPNSFSDLIFGGFIRLVGMSVCFLVGGICFIASFRVPNDRREYD